MTIKKCTQTVDLVRNYSIRYGKINKEKIKSFQMPQTRSVYLYWLGIYGYLHYGIGGKWGKINYKKSNYAHTAHECFW